MMSPNETFYKSQILGNHTSEGLSQDDNLNKSMMGDSKSQGGGTYS